MMMDKNKQINSNDEIDLKDLLLVLPLDVRIIGVEYQEQEFSGKEICDARDIKVIYNGRDHSFSSSSLRKRVAEGEKWNYLIRY